MSDDNFMRAPGEGIPESRPGGIDPIAQKKRKSRIEAEIILGMSEKSKQEKREYFDAKFLREGASSKDFLSEIV